MIDGENRFFLFLSHETNILASNFWQFLRQWTDEHQIARYFINNYRPQTVALFSCYGAFCKGFALLDTVLLYSVPCLLVISVLIDWSLLYLEFQRKENQMYQLPIWELWLKADKVRILEPQLFEKSMVISLLIHLVLTMLVVVRVRSSAWVSWSQRRSRCFTV